ncbi:MAG: four helix bundle protein [Dehalococcoidia bacterium]
MGGYTELEVWQRAMDLAVECHAASERFPRRQLFGLTSQLCRSSSSIPANIAEGQGRLNDREFRYHAGVARGSLMETETHVTLARRLGYLSKAEFDVLAGRCGEVGRLLNGLIRWLDGRINAS